MMKTARCQFRRLLLVMVSLLLVSEQFFRTSADASWRLEQEDARISWTCPMHREVQEEKPGRCPACQMALVETRLRDAWTCPLHATIVESVPGVCRVCRRDLLPTIVEVSWTCADHPEINILTAGSCPICKKSLVERTSTRPHQDHTPKHGGIFFMAPDNWHHLEGTYSQPGIFRVHLYDNYSQPLTGSSISGRAVVKEVWDQTLRQSREVVGYPMVPSAEGTSLEVRVGSLPLPTEISAKIRFQAGGREERFDFVFPEYSKEPRAGVLTRESNPTPSQKLPTLHIPQNAKEIVSAIDDRDAQIRQLIDKGAFAEVFVPALEAKDLGLALESHINQLEREPQNRVTLAVKQLVRGAWLLDWYGDQGNRDRVRAAYVVFAGAVHEIKKAYQLP